MRNSDGWSLDKILLASCALLLCIVFPVVLYLGQFKYGSHGSASDVQPEPELYLPDNSPPPPLQPGTNAVDFTSTTLDGQPYIFHSHSSNIKILDFWATWCEPCQMSIPGLESINNDLKSQGIRVVGVSVDTDTVREVPSFVRQLGMTYTVLADAKDNPYTQLTYNAVSLPSLYIIDGKGIVRWSYSGYWEGEEPYIRQIIANLQAGKPAGLP